jgi:hypothetical protein
VLVLIPSTQQQLCSIEVQYRGTGCDQDSLQGQQFCECHTSRACLPKSAFLLHTLPTHRHLQHPLPRSSTQTPRCPPKAPRHLPRFLSLAVCLPLHPSPIAPTNFALRAATCFFLGILFALFPYDYHVLWTTPAAADALRHSAAVPGQSNPRDVYFALQENHLKFLHASPPLISRILHIVVGTGLLGFMMKLYRPSEANMLFDGASLVLYMCGITVYIANIVKGLRTVTAGAYGGEEGATSAGSESDFIGREDSLRVLAASNTILALVLVGVLILQAGQWYAQRKEAEELEELDHARDEKAKAKAEAKAQGQGGSKKKQ